MQRGVGGIDLRQNNRAVAIFINHPQQASGLPVNSIYFRYDWGPADDAAWQVLDTASPGGIYESADPGRLRPA
jgi:hypothetical protein